MEYLKQHLSFEEQAEQLIQRGMKAEKDLLIQRLKSVSYYRLSGYWYPFRKVNGNWDETPSDAFREGTDFDYIWKRYSFDRRLRLLLIDAIERIEVHLRSLLAYYHSKEYGPFAYIEREDSLKFYKAEDREVFISSIIKEASRSKDGFVKHFRTKYGDNHKHLPVWIAVEIMTFGTVLSFYKSCSKRIKKEIASVYGVHEIVFTSWMLSLNTIRNICAHHGRLWNREMGIKPKLPKKSKIWNQPEISNERIFIIFCICKYCIDVIAPQSAWKNRLFTLLDEFQDIPIQSMGFPVKWREIDLWKTVYSSQKDI